MKPSRSRLNPAIQNAKIKAPESVVVYNKDEEDVSIVARKKEGAVHRGEKFADVLKDRTDARRTYTYSFISKLIQYKKRTSDDGLVVLHDKDREEKYFYTTDKDNLTYDLNCQMSSLSLNQPILNSPPTPVPSFVELARASPSKRLRMDKENIEFDENTCRICKIRSKTEADVRSDSLWMGCCQEGCDYWLHFVCKGFADATQAEVNQINFYCPEHNQRAKFIMQLASSKTSKKKKGGNSTDTSINNKSAQPTGGARTRGGIRRRRGIKTRSGASSVSKPLEKNSSDKVEKTANSDGPTTSSKDDSTNRQDKVKKTSRSGRQIKPKVQ